MVAVAASSACAIRLHICHRYVEIDVDMQKWDFVDGVLGVVMLLGNHRANAKIDSPTFLVVTLNEFFQHGRIACVSIGPPLPKVSFSSAQMFTGPSVVSKSVLRKFNEVANLLSPAGECFPLRPI